MLITENSKKLYFNITGYEFPDEKADARMEYNYDANWLICEIKYSDGDLSENYTSALLLTYELKELIDSLEKILDGVEHGCDLSFMEPYLGISISNEEDKVLFAIRYVHDTTAGAWKPRTVSSLLEKERAVGLLDELRGLLTRYPIR